MTPTLPRLSSFTTSLISGMALSLTASAPARRPRRSYRRLVAAATICALILPCEAGEVPSAARRRGPFRRGRAAPPPPCFAWSLSPVCDGGRSQPPLLLRQQRHHLALHQHRRIQPVIGERVAGGTACLVREHHQPFLVDGGAAGAVLHEHRHLDDVVGAAARRLED